MRGCEKTIDLFLEKLRALSHKLPVVRLCVRWNFFGIMGLYIEAQGIESVIVLLQVYAPNATG